MTVKDYAEETSLSIAEILKECKLLDIKVSNGEDFLDDDSIIMLDSAINLISTESEMSYDEDEVIDEKIDEIITESRIEKSMKTGASKQKLKKRDSVEVSKTLFKNQKKEMYKNKSKLKGNDDQENLIIFKEGMSLYSLAEAMKVNPAELIKKLITLGLMIGINDAIEYDIAEMLASEYSKVLKTEDTQNVADFESFEVVDSESDLVKRPPIVTIMGHVDHGKTSLLDYIRKTNVVSGEAGGITQAIGAYQVEHNNDKITFIDTPGHAAFTGMRARGASVTDIVIIIVAADDGVMPQTKEAVDHALSANVPIIVAINKIDKPAANPEKVMTELAELNITPEAWGGKYPFINISAHTGEGIDYLLETISLIAEVNEWKANPSRYATGAVIESRHDKNVGGVASFLIQNGTLRIGDPLVVGTSYAKVRSMKNSLGESILEAGPSTPVEITGLSANPSAGDKFMAFEADAEAKKIAAERLEIQKAGEKVKKAVTLDDLFANVKKDGQKEVNIVLKTDVRGSEEAVKGALEKIAVEDVKIKIVRSGIGAITESDVVLASASNAIIIGFNVVENNGVKEYAKDQNIEIRLYSIIYKVVEDIESAMKGMLDPEFEEKELGKAEIRRIFKFSKIGNIAGSYITDGLVKSGAQARIVRDGIVIAETKISSIQREKDTTKEVKKGFECGITLDTFNDIKENDIIVCFELVEVKK